MKRRVTLLGDSIRLIGYGEPVARALAEGFEVWQPDSNCRFVQHTLRELWTYASHIEGSDIIHWNNGLWDVCDLFGDGPFTPIDRYVEEMVRLATLLKKRTRVHILLNAHTKDTTGKHKVDQPLPLQSIKTDYAVIAELVPHRNVAAGNLRILHQSFKLIPGTSDLSKIQLV